jgi:hypothetical protein
MVSITLRMDSISNYSYCIKEENKLIEAEENNIKNSRQF